MATIARQRDLQDLADRLDTKRVTACVDKISQDLRRRSSSAWAKNALANFTISFARRSSLTSRSSSLTRLASVVVPPQTKTQSHFVEVEHVRGKSAGRVLFGQYPG